MQCIEFEHCHLVKHPFDNLFAEKVAAFIHLQAAVAVMRLIFNEKPIDGGFAALLLCLHQNHF